MNELWTRIEEIFRDTLSYDKSDKLPARDASLVDDGGLDDLDRVELTMSFEEAFAISIDDDEYNRCTTLQGFHDLIKSKLEEKGN